MIVKIQGTPINSQYIVAIEKSSEAPSILTLDVQTVVKRYSFKYQSEDSRNEAFSNLEKIWRSSGRFYEI
jgi:hypothetical protein